MSWKLLLNNSYVPYSGKPRACLIEGKSGRIYAGVRIENISFPLTIPAVQAACSICLSEQDEPFRIYLADHSLEQLSFWSNEFDLDIIVTDNPPISKRSTYIKELRADFSAIRRLKELLEQALTPNSDFPVSALLFTKTGYFEGVNVEVSEWTQGICAERVAISKAFAEGFTQFTRLEVHTSKGEISSPCGACRQVISELLPFHEIKLHHADGNLTEHQTVDLLPFSFKSTALAKKKG